MAFVRLMTCVLVSIIATSGHTKIIGHQDNVDNACELLTEQLAVELVGQPVKPGIKEHIPHLYSQCNYAGTEKGGYKVSFTTKFYPVDLLDYDNLDPMQLDFNVLFINGGKKHHDKKQFPGEATYVFHDQDLTNVFMITGITGPEYANGEKMRLGVNFQLSHPDMAPDARRDILMKQAWSYMNKLAKRAKQKQ